MPQKISPALFMKINIFENQILCVTESGHPYICISDEGHHIVLVMSGYTVCVWQANTGQSVLSKGQGAVEGTWHELAVPPSTSVPQESNKEITYSAVFCVHDVSYLYNFINLSVLSLIYNTECYM